MKEIRITLTIPVYDTAIKKFTNDKPVAVDVKQTELEIINELESAFQQDQFINKLSNKIDIDNIEIH